MQAKSTTHEHLLSVLITESSRFTGTVKILDAGCGRGVMMDWLRCKLPELRPGLRWEVYGYDVSDHRTVQKHSLPRQDRTEHISIKDPWPYPDEFFDVVISNQVMEHVAYPHQFLSQIQRVLRPGGFSAHLFPLRHYIWEGHLHLPFVHRIRNADLQRAYIRLLSRIGLGRFPDHHNALGTSIDVFSQQHVDFVTFFTRYLSYDQALELAQEHHFRGSFRYTRELYTRKIGRLLGRRPRYEYKGARRSALCDWLSVIALRYISGVTFFLEKENTYAHGTEESVSLALSAG